MSDVGTGTPPPAAPPQDGAAAMIRQAAALAVEDAVAHMRRVNTLATVSMGLAEQMVLGGNNAQQAVAALSLAQSLVEGATANFIRICEAAGKLGGAPPDKGA